MKTRIFCLVALLITMSSFVQGSDEFREEKYQGRRVRANQVIVKFKKIHSQKMQAPEIDEAVLEQDVDFHRPVGSLGAHLLHSRSKSVQALVAELSSNPNVEYVEPNSIFVIATTPNDTHFAGQWALQNTGQVLFGNSGTIGADIGAVTAWNTSIGSRSVVVGIIDEGIDYNHPDLAANMWNAPSAFTVLVGGIQTSCPPGAHGFNLVDRPRTCDPAPQTGGNHGTFVAGIIGALGNNTIGVSGLNWATSMISLRALSDSGGATTSDLVDAISVAVQLKQKGINLRVLNNSYLQSIGDGGIGTPSQAMINEIRLANDNDILFVAAAGNASQDNDLNPTFPAQYGAAPFSIPNVIAVANTNNQDGLHTTSSFGAQSVHLGAPGTNVFSTIRTAETITSTPGYFAGGSVWPADINAGTGTSASSPYVAGAAALLLSHCSINTPTLKGVILNNVDLKPSLNGKTITGGRLNVARAIQNCAFAINVSLSGTGTGGVTSSPSGIACGTAVNQCSAIYALNSNVTLSAITAGNSSFVGWSGACNGTGSCNLQMNQIKNVTATFNLSPPPPPPQSISKPQANFDGDGKADIAVWTPSTGVWSLWSSATHSSMGTIQWGTSGDTPLVGDFDGDGKTDVAVYTPSTGIWSLWSSATHSSMGAVQWGSPGTNDIPRVGDFDGDRKSDLAVWTPSTGVWSLRSSATQSSMGTIQWGTSGDIPPGGQFRR